MTLLSACGNDTALIISSPAATAGTPTQSGITNQLPTTSTLTNQVPTGSEAVAQPSSTLSQIVTATVGLTPGETGVAISPANPTSVVTAFTGTTGAASTTASASSSSTNVPRFEAAGNSCPFKLPTGQILNQTVQCGYVIVPELHAQASNGKTIKLAVLVFKSKATSPAPEPVIYLEGGPGGYIQSIIDLMTGDFYEGFTARGDAIFFDQRGVGNSQPSLHCPEIETQAEQDAPLIWFSRNFRALVVINFRYNIGFGIFFVGFY